MRILADVGPIYNGQLTGIGYLTDELLEHLSKMSELHGFAFNFRGKKHIELDFPVDEQKLLPGKLLTYPRYLKIDLPLSTFFRLKGYDVVLGTNYLIPPTGHVPSIPIVHDLCFVDHPEWVQSRNAHILQTMLPKTLERSKALVTISEFSAQRIKEIYGYRKPILIINIPPKRSVVQPSQPKDTRIIPKKYFLFVGTIEPRKNLATLLDAYESLSATKQSEYKLVLAGKPGWDPEVLLRLKKSANKNIIYLDYVPEGERNWLYAHSAATILPSHYEGFGMTILEALDAGSPTITSDIPPHREILGNSGAYFDCLDIVKLASTLSSLTEHGRRAKLFADQNKVLRRYNWKDTTREVFDFVQDILRNNGTVL